MFDSEGTQQPQSPLFMQWVKWNLIQGNGVIAFVMLKGDTHDKYGLGAFDHAMPIWGVYSESELNTTQPLNETNIYPDDWIVHGSNYMPDGDANLGYFRKIRSLPDTTNMTGNCKLAQENLPDKQRNEMFPCINDQQNYGAAVRGLIDPSSKTYPLTLFVSVLREPNVRVQEDMKEMFGTIKITGLPLNGTFTIWRFDNIKDYPTDSNFNRQMPHTKAYDFNGEGQTYQWIDKDKINSDGATYYACTDRV